MEFPDPKHSIVTSNLFGHGKAGSQTNQSLCFQISLGQGGMGRKGTGWDQHGRRHKHKKVRGGQERPTGTSSIIFKFFLLSFSFFFFLITSFSAEYVNRRGGMGCERRRRDCVSFVLSSGGRGGNGYVFGHFCSLFSSSLLLAVFIAVVSFFAKITNRRAGAGSDRTDTGGDRKTGRDEGVKGYVPCHFLLSI